MDGLDSIDAPEERTAESDGYVAQEWYRRPKSLRRRLIDRLAHWSGGSIASSSFRSSLAYHRARDRAENDKCRLEDGQQVETYCVWATEVYTLETAGALLRGLGRFGSDRSGFRNRDPADWVRQQRRRPGSSLYVHMSRPGTRMFTGVLIDLPDFASYAVATIWSATPSLTVMTVMFMLKDGERERLQEILKSDHPTRLEPYGATGFGLFTPELERRRLIAEVRAVWIKQASCWFNTHLPGLFSTSGNTVPSCELTVLTGLKPFPGRSEDRISNRHRISLDALQASHGDVYLPARPVPAETIDAGIYFSPDLSLDDLNTRHSIVAMSSEGYRCINADAWGNDVARHMWAFDSTFRPIFAQWSLRHVLEFFGDRVSATRDRFTEVVGGSAATKGIALVRRHTADCADAATIAREVAQGIDNRSLRISNDALVLRDAWDDSLVASSGAFLRDSLRRNADRLLVELTELNTALHAQAALLSAHANLKLQPWIILLAVVSAITGGIAAIEPIEKLWGPSTKPYDLRANPPAVPLPPAMATHARPRLQSPGLEHAPNRQR